MNQLFFFVVLLALVYISQAQPSYKDVVERECIPQTELVPKLFKGVDFAPFLKPTFLYMPMASKGAYRLYAEDMLGRPPTDLMELEMMEINLECGPLFATVNNIGFPAYGNPSWQQTCVVTGLPDVIPGLLPGLELKGNYTQGTCNTASLHAVPLASVINQDSIVWGNNAAGVFLITRCQVLENIQDWKVISFHKTVPPADVAVITQKIQELGFSPNNIQYLPYA